MQALLRELHDLLRHVFPGTEPAVPALSAKPEFGDLQISSAMALAKTLKQKPRDLAAQIQAAVAAHPAIARTEIAGPGFVNLWLRDEWLARAADERRADPRLGLTAAHDRGTVVLDYSSPNAAKKMHVAHLRSTIIGDAIRRVLDAAGYQVVPVNHLGDWGTQFGKLLVAYRRWADPAAFERDPVGELLRLYIKFGDEEKKLAPAITDEELDEDEEKIVTPLLMEARAELVKLQRGDADNLALWRKFRDASVEELQHMYRRLGVRFAPEDFIGESFYNDRLAATVNELVKAGIAEESRGALVVFFKKPDGTTDEMTPFLIRKGDGGYLYATTDIAALRYRTERWHPVRIIVVTDERQQLHFRQLAAVGKRLGIENLEHVWFGLMRLPEGTIQTKTGRLISLEALLDEAERRAYDVARAQREDLSEPELREVARVVGIGAVKYNDLSRDRQTLITFTFDKALALSGNTAPYLQYAYARIQSILSKTSAAPGPVATLLPVERELVKRALGLPSVVEQVATTLRPHQLCEYLFELANAFSSFYNDAPVLKADSDELRASRLALCELVARTLKTGLDLLGIEVLARM